MRQTHLKSGLRCRTRVGVPLIVVMRAFLLAHKLLIHDLFELDHFGGCSGVRLVWLGFRALATDASRSRLVVLGLELLVTMVALLSKS